MELAASMVSHVSEPLFEAHVVAPILPVLVELLGSLPSLFVSHWPKFCFMAPSALPLEVICSGLRNALEKEAVSEVSEADSVALLVASAWIEENLDMYGFVESCLRDKLGGDFENVDVIAADTSAWLASEATAAFGAIRTFLFCVLSGVRLDGGCQQRLREAAEESFGQQQDEIYNLVRSCEMIETRVVQSSPSPLSQHSPDLSPRPPQPSGVRMMLSRSLDDAAASFQSTPVSASSHGGRRRKGWQLMSSQKSMIKVTATGSHVERRVHAEDKRGWLSKLAHADLAVSACPTSSPLQQQRRWKRRWVVIEEAKCVYFRGDGDSEPLGCIPLYLCSSVRTHPEISDRTFGLRCGHLINFVFEASSVAEMTSWLFTIQQWVAKLRMRNEPLVHSILAVPRWWKKLRSKQSLEHYTALVERGNEESVLSKCPIECELERPHPSHRSDGPFVTACAMFTQGQRPTMEDRHLMCADLANARRWDFEGVDPVAMFAVCDGHGGDQAAVFAAENLPLLLSARLPNLPLLNLQNEAEVAMLRDALVTVFVEMDKNFLSIATDPLLEQPILAGSTVIAVLLHADRFITTVNLGDSRAVLCRGGEAVALSRDHKPNDPEERRRVEAAGGWITESLEMDVTRLWRLNPRLYAESRVIPQQLAGEEIAFVPTFRLNGELLVSRAIGDAETKGELKNEFWEEGRVFAADVVSCVPDVVTMARSPHDQFLLIACDGLWDVMSNQEAIDFVSARLAEHSRPGQAQRLVRSVEESPSGKQQKALAGGYGEFVKKTGADLVTEALRRGSLDNISVVLVLLDKH